jgi:hypothetical protein
VHFHATASKVFAQEDLRQTAEQVRLAAYHFDETATYAEVTSQFERIEETLITELKGRTFLRIAQEYVRMLDRDDWLGPQLPRAFPEARQDVRDAGTCIATGCGTAAVFHLMRITEHGLRKLAKKVKVTLTHKGRPHPLEYADWNKLITGIRGKITTLKQHPHGRVRDRNLQFYSDLADQCEYMKDIWRNAISHARMQYTAQEAEGVAQRVAQFMNKLTTDMRKHK